MSDRYVHTIWCDDIRQEVGNKPSFMGIYTSGMVPTTRPATLPRLGIWVWISSPVDLPFQHFAVKVRRDDGTVFAEIPQQALDIDGAKVRPGSSRIHLQAVILAGPVQIPAQTRYFEVVVQTESEELYGPKLWIDWATPLSEDSSDVLEVTGSVLETAR